MKKLTSILLIAFALIAFNSCEKAEDVSPDDQTEDPGDDDNNNNNNGDVTEVDVLGLNQNFAKADGVSKEKLDNFWVEGYGEGDNEYTKLSFFGAHNTMIEITVKGSEPKNGNYSLKKWALGSGSSATEVVIRVAIAGTLLDFETSESDKFSITTDAEGFFVLKMAPIVGIKKNNWDDELTAPISLHIVANSSKVIASEDGVNMDRIAKYGFGTSANLQSNQPKASVNYSDDDGPINSISISFYDFDYTVASVGLATHTLSQRAYSVQETILGTVPKGIHFSSGWSGNITQDYTLEQEIEVELTAKYIILKYSDIKMVDKSDASNSFTISGDIMIAR